MDFLAHVLAQGAWLGIRPPACPAGRSGHPSALSSLGFYIVTTGAPRWWEGLARGDSGGTTPRLLRPTSFIFHRLGFFTFRRSTRSSLFLTQKNKSPKWHSYRYFPLPTPRSSRRDFILASRYQFGPQASLFLPFLLSLKGEHSHTLSWGLVEEAVAPIMTWRS